jgi:hypothetical protein
MHGGNEKCIYNFGCSTRRKDNIKTDLKETPKVAPKQLSNYSEEAHSSFENTFSKCVLRDFTFVSVLKNHLY